jgi:hypothetical protein
MDRIIVERMGVRELVAVFILTGIVLSGQGIAAGDSPQPGWDLFSDSWVATDALGRRLPGLAECGPVREGKFVGMFYWTWHTHSGGQGPYDISAILAKDPANPQFGPIGASHHWGQPQLGYYISTDRYVIRKHAGLLTEAGVDVVIFDTTNPPFTFKESYEALCEEYRAMRKEGNRTPQIAFLAPFGDPTVVVKTIFDDLYSKGLYSELWFQWKGKPLLMADPAQIQDAKIREFFTCRKPIPSYFTGPGGPEQWGWLEVSPQHAFTDKAGKTEQVTVGVAQNAVGTELSAMSHKDGAMGRSWHKGAKDTRPDAVNYGYNFAEQWDRALKLDPEFIFITGWNEWVAGRFSSWSKYTGKDSYFPDALFVDEYNQEYSRDIEPMVGGHADNYYYQMTGYIRRFKGVRPPQPATGNATIQIDGRFDDWKGVGPEFRDAIGDTMHRDHKGYGSTQYRDTTGRNDIVLCKMAADRETLYCFVQTREPITAFTDKNWMLLFLNTDGNSKTGWEGYDFVINAAVADAKTTTLKKSAAGWDWKTVGQLSYASAGNQMELAIPLKALGVDRLASVEFHWADNVQKDGDLADFYVSGDSAPDGRYNYRFIPRDGSSR